MESTSVTTALEESIHFSRFVSVSLVDHDSTRMGCESLLGVQWDDGFRASVPSLLNPMSRIYALLQSNILLEFHAIPTSYYSLLMSNIDRILGENDIRKQYAPRKQFEAAKEAMDDPHCDDGDSNRELRNSAARCTTVQSKQCGMAEKSEPPTYFHD